MKKIIESLKNYIKTSWKKLLRDIFIFSLIIIGIQYWQTRNLLPSSQKAPDFYLRDLKGRVYTLKQYEGKKVVLYFFAPWCSVCHMSMENLEKAKEFFPNIGYYFIAMDYENPLEIKKFIRKHNLTIPVLLGKEEIRKIFKIEAFPTYYVLNKDHFIKSTSVGYSSELGLLWRIY